MGDPLFRFGLTNSAVGDLTTWTTAARRVESLGYATLLLPDTMRTPAPFPALAAAASVTTSLRVGTWVLCDPLRKRSPSVAGTHGHRRGDTLAAQGAVTVLTGTPGEMADEVQR